MSLNIETLGFGRGDALPGPMLQPPPLFPVIRFIIAQPNPRSILSQPDRQGSLYLSNEPLTFSDLLPRNLGICVTLRGVLIQNLDLCLCYQKRDSELK